MYMVDVTSDDFKKNLEKSQLVIVPVGSVEAHGHHCPLGTDIFAPRLFCKMLNERMGDEIWIAPEVPFGQSYDLSVYPGTINVPSDVFSEYLYWVGKGLYDNGMRKLVFLNGHGGNRTALNLATEKLVKIGMDVFVSNWWADYMDDIVKITGERGHAGKDETSAMLYYDESLVKMEVAAKNYNKAKINVSFKGSAKVLLKDAVLGDSTTATKEFGEKIFKAVTDDLERDVRILQSGVYYTED